MAAVEEDDQHVQMWKVKQLIRKLSAARGNGTSMISLIIPPGDQISRVQKMLGDEFGTASNIKSRVTRQSVLSAITSTQQKLKIYTKVPPNGLVVYCGMIITEDGKPKKVNIDFEPYKPINTSLYLCDNKFHTEALDELLRDDDTFGFIIMDGNGCLFGTLCGSNRTVLHKFTVDLPKKHGRGGQSALRFARLRLEKRKNYIRKVAEIAQQLLIDNSTNMPNVAGIVCAGAADFKQKLQNDANFDPRLKKAVIKTLDVSYGGENGFNQAIELAAECLQNVKYFREKALVSEFFELIAKETGTYCYGVKDTLNALEMSAVKTLIVYDNLLTERVELEHPTTGEKSVHFLNPGDEAKKNVYVDEETGLDMKEISREPLVEWFAENYKLHGATLEFITDKSQEGNQFCKGFGGVGAILQWKVDFLSMEIAPGGPKEEEEPDLDDFDFDEYDAAADYEGDFI
eukprot:INCI11164.1.p1 GENE.INCI11164.1~~INCI11164.1.p1  ORF type:complete len:512 (+),score=112.23 INCI11164.1:163-1536(+)